MGHKICIHLMPLVQKVSAYIWAPHTNLSKDFLNKYKNLVVIYMQEDTLSKSLTQAPLASIGISG